MLDLQIELEKIRWSTQEKTWSDPDSMYIACQVCKSRIFDWFLHTLWFQCQFQLFAIFNSDSTVSMVELQPSITPNTPLCRKLSACLPILTGCRSLTRPGQDASQSIYVLIYKYSPLNSLRFSWQNYTMIWDHLYYCARLCSKHYLWLKSIKKANDIDLIIWDTWYWFDNMGYMILCS